MELAAIFVVGGFSPAPPDGVEPHARGIPVFPAAKSYALQPLLGLSAVDRMASMLCAQGIGKVVVLSEAPLPSLPRSAAADQEALQWQEVHEGQIWRQAESAFVDLAQCADEVLVLQMGRFLELDLQDLLAHHYEHRCRITSTVSPTGQRLHAYVISANRRNDAASLFRSGLEQVRTPCADYVFHGYCNPLETAADFRQVTIDALLQKNSIRPQGATEVRPGVWLDARAEVYAGARLVPPVYLGECSRVLPGALVTRCAVLEHHTTVCRGSVVENATMLPYTQLGEKLELKNSVASGGSLVHLRHGVTMEVGDPRLLVAIPQHGPSWAQQFVSGIAKACSLESLQRLVGSLSSAHSASEHKSRPSAEPVHAGRGERAKDESGFRGEVAVARRYGEQ